MFIAQTVDCCAETAECSAQTAALQCLVTPGITNYLWRRERRQREAEYLNGDPIVDRACVETEQGA